MAIIHMPGKTSPAARLAVQSRSFYSESPPKRSRLHENNSNNLRPAFKTLKENLIKFDRKLSEPIKSIEQDQDLKQPATRSLPNTPVLELDGFNVTSTNNQNAESKLDQQPTANTTDLDSLVNSPEHNDEIRPSSFIGPVTSSEFDQHQQQLIDSAYNSDESKSLDRDSPLPLKNLGNTCYENSIIQCLFNLDSFMDDFEQSMTEVRQLVQTSKDDHTSSTHLIPSRCTARVTDSDVRYRIANAFYNLYKCYTQSELETRLEELKSAVGERSSQFNSSHQQDASEFFYHVIDSIQELYQSLDKTKDEENPVTKAFELELDYSIKCPKCHHQTKSESGKVRTLHLALPNINCSNEDNNQDQENCFARDATGSLTPPTSDLGSDSPRSDEALTSSVEKENQALEDDNVQLKDKNSHNTASIAKLDITDRALSSQTNSPSNSGSDNQRQSNEPKQQSLNDALRNYFKDDTLEWSCTQEACDSKKRTKKCSIRKLPQVLFITLARYEYTGKKNLDEIHVPFELTVPFDEYRSTTSTGGSEERDSHQAADHNEYQLVAVVCHLGSSLYAGHYTSYVLNQNNSSWYSCDDDSIVKVSESEVKNDASRSGYCFFYAQKHSN